MLMRDNTTYNMLKRSSLLRLTSCLRSLSCVDTHPRLLDEAKEFGHVRTPIVHHVLCRPRLAEVDDACWSVDPRPYSARNDQSAEGLLGFLRRQIQEVRQRGEADASVVLGYNADVLRENLSHEMMQAPTHMKDIRVPRCVCADRPILCPT